MNPTSPALPLLRIAVTAAALAAAASAQIRVDACKTRHLSYLDLDPYSPIQCNDLAAGDVDGDGDLDLVIACNSFGSRVLFNDGDGVFSRSVVIANFATRVALVDVDGDGDLDAFFAGGGSTYALSRPCSLVQNDGAGNFTPYGSLPSFTTDLPRLQAGDIDHDGDVDFLVLRQPNHFLRNDGGGVFTDQTAWLPALGSWVDLTGDGVLDILTGTVLHRGNGDGTFTPTTLPFNAYLTGDLDGNGSIDVISYPLRAWRNNGNGTSFTAAGSMPPLWQPAWGGMLPQVVDLDGDGFAELVGVDDHLRPFVWHHTGDFVYTNVAASWLEPQTTTAFDYVWTASLVFDADGDGDLDLFTGGSEGRGSSSTTVGIPPKLFLNRTGQDLVEATRPIFPRLQTTGTPMVAGDVDGDGDTDLVFDTLWLQDDTGCFEPGSALPPGGFAFFAAQGPGLLEDFDGDGDLDLFLTDGPGPENPGTPLAPRLARNDGLGHFTAVPLPATVVTVGTACAAGDVDGDGDLDIVMGTRARDFNTTGDRFFLLRNDGSGTFTDAAAQMPAMLYSCGHLALRDFDRDGDLDILAAVGRQFQMSPRLLYFANDGTGTFVDETATRLPTLSSAWGLAVADLDGDGDLDFATQDSFSGSGSVLTNNGSGVFTAQPGTRGRHIVDWDGDGTLVDLTPANEGVNIDSTFVHLTTGFGGGPSVEILPFDCDGDGDMDLAFGTPPSFANGQYAAMQQGILVNLQRDLRIASLPRLGQPHRVQLRAVNGTAATYALVAISAGVLPQRVAVPTLGKGLLAIDPNLLLALDLATVPDADTAAEVVHAIPNQPALLGLQVATQALFVPAGHEWDAHFSNVVIDLVEN